MRGRSGSAEPKIDNEYGSAYKSAMAYQTRQLRVLEWITMVEDWFAGQEEGEIDIKKILLKPMDSSYEEWLLVATADMDGEPKVAFQRDTGMIDVLVGFGKRLRNGSVKWKEDKPYGK